MDESTEKTIDKPAEPARRPNLEDYERVRREFSWEEARGKLDGLPENRGVNIAHEAVDRHATGERADRVAIRWLPENGDPEELTYAELAARSSRFANVLAELGVEEGDRVFALSRRIPELYVAMIGTLKHRAVFSPLFSAFGPEPVRQRLDSGDGRVLVTTARQYRQKVQGLVDELPGLEHVLIASRGGGAPEVEASQKRVRELDPLMSQASEEYTIGPTDPEQMALLHFTSGTTGKPKGAIHVHEAVVAHHVTGEYALDFHDDDVFWCTADPGWVTGTSYGIVSPLTNGITMVVDEAEYGADRWYSVVEREEVSVWYTAPTAIRMLMRAGREVADDYDLGSLRFVGSVGEPLNPEAVVWTNEVWGLPAHDNWWQTETGGIMIANYASMPIKPGSMGKPLPGIEAAVVERQNGSVEVLDEPGEEGELALRPGWPSMFRGYLHMEEKYDECFVDGWYLTEDMAKVDEDGYFWFVGRADDMIKTSGHLVGPFEVESALIEHPAVAEAGVIGKPHEIAGQIVKGFVTLNRGHEPDDGAKLQRELIGFCREKLGSTVAPREVEIVDELPKTESGKIMRRVLQSRELEKSEEQ